MKAPTTAWSGATASASNEGISSTAGVQRRALLNRLDVFAQLTVLRAPPGYGKTTLVRRWAAERRARGDRVRIWSAARAAAEEIAGFVSAGTGRSTIVVVDGIDGRTDAAVDEALVALMHEHPTLRVVVCTRVPVALQSLAWQEGLETTLVERTHLAASPVELAQMAASWHHELSVERAVELQELTGGWPRVARLVLDESPAHGPFALDLAAQYIETTMLDPLDQTQREVAAALSLATGVTSMHVDAVAMQLGLASEQMASHLGALQASDVLQSGPGTHDLEVLPVVRCALARVHAQDARRWHEVFAEASVRQDADEALPDLLRHARAADRWDLLSDAWKAHGNTLVDRFVDAVVTAYSRIPAEARARLPYLTVPMSVAHSISDGETYSDVQHVLYESLRPLALRFTSDDRAGMDAETWLSAGAAAIVTHRLDADFPGALSIASELDEHPRRHTFAHVAPMRHAWFLMQDAMTLLAAGEGNAAYRRFNQSYAAAHDVSTARFIAANSASNLALMTAFAGDTEQSTMWLGRYENFAEEDRWTQGHVAAGAELTRAILALDALDEERATRHLASVGNGTDIELWPFIAYARSSYALLFGSPVAELADLESLCAAHADHAHAGGLAQRLTERLQADLLLATGQLNRAASLLHARGRRREWWLETPRSRLHLLAGEPARARHTADSSGHPSALHRDQLDRVLLSAVASDLTGRRQEADAAFETAVALAERIGTLAHYLLVPERVLTALLTRGGHVELAEKIAALRPRGRSVFPDAARYVRLSPRETVVLNGMSRADSFAQIASSLSVSINTVKKQAASIYAKLGVNDRDAALLAARRLGLLSRER